LTYTSLAVAGLVGSVAVDLFGWRTGLVRRRLFWTAYAIVLFFQLVTNGLLTGLSVVRYDEDAILGARLAFAPVEDLLFGFALVLLTLSTWVWLGRRTPTRHASGIVGLPSRAYGGPVTATPAVRLVVWRRLSPSIGHSLARIAHQNDGSWHVHGTEVLVDGEARVACSFGIELDVAWVTRAVRVEVVSDVVTGLHLLVDEGGRWWQDGAERPDLRGCLDVDVAATPVTNTFPIRRLADLPVGEAATFPVAWIEVPSLQVLRIDQSYRRLGGAPDAEEWEYSDPVHGAFRLVVDDVGVVRSYQGFAERVDG